MGQEDDPKRGNASLRLARLGGPDSPCRNARSCPRTVSKLAILHVMPVIFLVIWSNLDGLDRG
jgi:hypothetical protein